MKTHTTPTGIESDKKNRQRVGTIVYCEHCKKHTGLYTLNDGYIMYTYCCDSSRPTKTTM